MEYKIGDLVTRNSHNNDTVFEIVKIESGVVFLKGVNVRLIADSPVNDLKAYDRSVDIEEEEEFLKRASFECSLNRDDYFYLPGKILHIDGDEDYLNRCLDYYHKASLNAVGVVLKENEVTLRIKDLLEQYNPTIIVITGHDAYYKSKDSYKNSDNFVSAVKEARKYEKSHQKLVIIAGACQSNYEDLIKAGATFASSPKRINIHALDPAIIATKISLTCTNDSINLRDLLNKTKYGSEGIGGLQTNGMMYVGFPR